MAYLFYAALAYVVYKAVQQAGAKGSPKKRRRKQVRAAPSKPPHEVLGIEPDASEAEIRKAYQKLIREYHPDRVAHAAEELQALANERSKQINAAYAVLMERVRSS